MTKSRHTPRKRRACGVSSTPRPFVSSLTPRITGSPAFAGDDGCGLLRPSLPANGSHECAPDDRLGEAIQSTGLAPPRLLRRFAPRNDSSSIAAIFTEQVQLLLHRTVGETEQHGILVGLVGEPVPT